MRLATILLLLSCSDAAVLEPVPEGPDDGSPVARFVTLVNAHRQSIGCPALTWNASVAEVARQHSEDMVQRGFFSHTNPDGDSPGDRLDDAGIEWRRWAENIAAGYPSAEAVMNAWLNSAGHRRNIETCALFEHGVGLVDQHWTHVFVTL